MRKYLLPEKGNFYKANLHCHTTVSDGKATPEQIKDIYKRHGYSIVAFTDHNVQVPHADLDDESFLALNGVEYNLNAEGYPGENRDVKTCHLCMIAERRDIKYQVCFTESSVNHGGARNFIEKSMRNPDEPDFKREHTPECVNRMIAEGRKAGYFVTYNHPVWSRENYSDYINYHGMNAMEIYNYGCWVVGYPEYNSREYDDILHGGERIYCIAADDNHNKKPEDDPLFDSCGGWVMIKADKLEYDTIGAALENGQFYSSNGPEIKGLWFEGGKLHVECTPAKRISVVYGIKIGGCVAAAGNEKITEATFDVKPNRKWFRVHIDDGNDGWADSNAYFTDEMPYGEENEG